MAAVCAASGTIRAPMREELEEEGSDGWRWMRVLHLSALGDVVGSHELNEAREVGGSVAQSFHVVHQLRPFLL